jgi:hypothetical protein
MRPPRALPAAHFERNNITIICETVHEIDNVLTIIKTLLHTIAQTAKKISFVTHVLRQRNPPAFAVCLDQEAK